MSSEVLWRPMTREEQSLAQALAKCSCSPGSFAKRFARSIGVVSEGPRPLISEGQATVLRKLVHTYRRQIPAESIPESERHLLVKRKEAV